MSRWLFYADTPLQVYNASLLAIHLSKKSKCSIVIYGQFSDAKRIGNSLSKLNLFEHVYYLEEYHCNGFKNILMWQIKIILGVNKTKILDIPLDNYDYFALSFPSPSAHEVLMNTRKKNPSLRTVFFEDGTGTYVGNCFRIPLYFDKPPARSIKSPLHVEAIKKVFRLVTRSKYLYRPVEIYVKRPDLLDFHSSIPVKKIPTSPTELQQLLSVFPSPSCKPQINGIVIFDVMRNQTVQYGSDIIDSVLQKLTSDNINIYLRNHPRSTIKSIYADSCTDISGGLWEILCQQLDLSNALLIGIGSTAQLSPLIEIDKKPSLLFLHRIAFEQNDIMYQLMEQCLNISFIGYKDAANKIFAPTDIDEALSVLQAFQENFHR